MLSITAHSLEELAAWLNSAEIRHAIGSVANQQAPALRIKLAAGLTEFPALLYCCAEQLEILDLSDNQLSTLPTDLARFVRLKRLFLTNNHFCHIPAVLAQCPALLMLSFKGNRLTEFAAAVLPEQLQWLILTDNQLPDLPADVGRYQALQKLALAGNRLTTLPDSMQHCQQLGLLRLSLNQFASFPDWLFQLPKLAWLALGANPACPVADKTAQQLPWLAAEAVSCLEILGQGASGVIYRAQLQQPLLQAAPDGSLSTLPVGTEVALKRFKGWITSDGCPKDELQNYLNAGAHPNLIPVLARLQSHDLPALAMQLIPKQFTALGLPPSFETITRDTFAPGLHLSALQLLGLARQLAAVLLQLHQRNIIHGDLYAHNVLHNVSGQLYLGDFGAATALDALPLWQQQLAKAQEVRAFGYFIEDLLPFVVTDQRADSAETRLGSALAQLAGRCLSADLRSRPLAAELVQQLEQLGV